MKITFLLSFLVFSTVCLAQPDPIKQLDIYSVQWNAKYRIARTVKNVNKDYEFHFSFQPFVLQNMFENPNDLISHLTDSGEMERSSTLKLVNSLVVLTFDSNQKVKLFLNKEGNFFLQGNWYKINHTIYYALFKYFSNEIVPENVVLDAKNNSED